MKARVRNLICLALLAVVGAGCGGDGDGDSAKSSRAQAPGAATATTATATTPTATTPSTPEPAPEPDTGSSPPPSDPDRVRADYLRYSNALASGDYDEACSRMSAAMRRKTIADAPEIQASAGLPKKAVDCAGAVELVVEHVFTPADPEKTRRDVAAATVEVGGERATLEATSFSAEMAWSGDRWVLDSP